MGPPDDTSLDRLVAGNESREGHILLNFYARYSFVSGTTTSTITARLDNATDTPCRNHLNFLKDLAPEMGRNFRVVYDLSSEAALQERSD